MAKLGLLALLGIAVIGCGSEPAPAPESTASKGEAQAAARNWNPQQIEAFKKAHDDAKAGRDEGADYGGGSPAGSK